MLFFLGSFCKDNHNLYENNFKIIDLKFKQLTGDIVVTFVSAEFPSDVDLPDDLDVFQERHCIPGTFLMARSYQTGN